MNLDDVSRAEKLLYDMEMEEKNWRSARAVVGELLVTVKQAHKELNEFDTTKMRLENEIKGLEHVLKNGRDAADKKNTAYVVELQEHNKELEAKIADAQRRVREANEQVVIAEKKADEAVERQFKAERDLGEVEQKVKVAQELLVKLTQVGA